MQGQRTGWKKFPEPLKEQMQKFLKAGTNTMKLDVLAEAINF